MKNHIFPLLFAFATLFAACQKDALDTTNIVGNAYFITNSTNGVIYVNGSYNYTRSYTNGSTSSTLTLSKEIDSRKTYLVVKNKMNDFNSDRPIDYLQIRDGTGLFLYLPNNGTNGRSEDWANMKYWKKTLNATKDTAYYTLTIY